MKTKFSKFLPWQREIMRHFLPFVRPERSILFLLCILNIAMTAINALLIWKLGVAISQITAGRFQDLNQTLLIIAGLVLANQLIRIFYAYHYQHVSLHFVDRIRGSVLSHIMIVSFPVNTHYSKGDLIARLTGDIDRVLTFVINAPLNLLLNCVVLVVYAGMLIWIDWQLSLIALAMAPLFFLSQHYVAPKTGDASRHFTREKARLLSIEEQVLANLRGISSFNSEELIRRDHQKQFNIARNWALKARRIRVLYNTFFTLMLYLTGVVIVFSGISGIQSGQLSIGILISFLVYIRNLAGPVRIIARMPIQLQADRVAAERIMEVMTAAPAVADSPSAIELPRVKGEITFRSLSFAYSDATPPVFTALNETIAAGESVALVGPSGAGKSTLAYLLMRFFDPSTGAILIDGIDIREVTLKSLRRQISVVWQEPFLINGSIRENLLLAAPHAIQDQINAACRSSYAWEFIDRLENGLDTVIGTHGVSLSAGQCQRLAIAQAFLRDTPILILDEASSALDSHSEQQIVDALQQLRENRTTLMIAHRFSSVRSADRILYLDGKGIITAGTHDTLMNTIPAYQDAVDWQLARP